VSESPAAARRALRARWGRLQAEADADGAERPRVAVMATFTADPLAPYLGCALTDRDVPARLELAPYNQVEQTCLSGGAAFGPAPLAATVALWRLEDVAGDAFARAHLDETTAQAMLDDAVTELAHALAAYHRARPGLLVIALPPAPESPHIERLGLVDPVLFGRLHRRAVERFTAALPVSPDVAFVCLDALVRTLGHTEAFDRRKGYLFRQPFSEAFWQGLGEQLARLVRARRVAARKVIAIDCDNTLWGGVVGEDGLDGIRLGAEFPGSAFRDVQARLLDLKAKGVLLTLVSKNNEADVWEVFDQHEGMRLKRTDIVAWRINWLPKPENIASLAAELSVGTDSFIFLDDSAFETEQMRTERPEVFTLRVPEEPADMLDALDRCEAFDRLEVTAEDRARSEMYQQERARQVAQETLSPEEFLIRLGLHVRVASPAEAQLTRVAQLINKTNQFNLTTLRRTPDEVAALLRSTAHRLLAVWVVDRFGDYGLTGLAVLEAREDGWHLDTLLLSCRVLARGVETALLAVIGEQLRAANAPALHARFIPTAKNAPAADFLPNHGFTRLDDTRFVIAADALPARPAHLQIDLD